MIYLLIVIFLLIGIMLGAIYFLNLKTEGEGNSVVNLDLSVYQKKAFLFDSVSELKVYKILVKNYGDRYFIFSQVNYSHLIEPKRSSFKDERKYRSRIDRKSADFVMCDKERVVPELIIELDGPSHLTQKRKLRDEFVDSLSNIVGMKILHITTENLEESYIVEQIKTKLNYEKSSI